MKVFFSLLLLVLALALGYFLLVKPDFLLNTEKSNRAAEGFSRFYSNYRNSVLQSTNRSNFVISLPDGNVELIPQLQRREVQVNPADPAWRGEVTRRRFQSGTTLKAQLGQYVQQEEMVLFWTLPRDYVIKQFFETNGSLLETLQELAFTLGPDFKQQVSAWYCPKSRALVLTDLQDPFLQQNCIATPRSLPQRR
jgi:hypothetical protein